MNPLVASLGLLVAIAMYAGDFGRGAWDEWKVGVAWVSTLLSTAAALALREAP